MTGSLAYNPGFEVPPEFGVPWVIAPLREHEVAAVSHLTFPAYRPLLAECRSRGESDKNQAVRALVAWHGAMPVGLVLAQIRDDNRAEKPNSQSALLFSVSVLPDWRQRGLATDLLQAMEQVLRQAGCVSVEVDYTTRLPSLASFESLLQSCQWAPPEATLLMSLGYSREVIQAPWVSAVRKAPPGFELFEWAQLRADERASLAQAVAVGDIPKNLSPFADEEELDPNISVGVRHHGEVVAWMTVTRSPFIPDALCYRSTYVRPQWRAARALGPLVLSEAIRRHVASPVCEARPVGAFGMSFKESVKMLNFYRKRLAPYCFSSYESRCAVKQLV